VQLVQEMDRYLVAAGNRPVRISELTEVFKVNRRRLHRVFNDAVGISPIAFLRRKRLGDVHVALLMGGPATTVREVVIEMALSNSADLLALIDGCSASCRPGPCSDASDRSAIINCRATSAGLPHRANDIEADASRASQAVRTNIAVARLTRRVVLPKVEGRCGE
jgi:hypothetical protein